MSYGRHQRMDMDMKAFGAHVRFLRNQRQLTPLQLTFLMNRIWHTRYPKENLISENWVRKVEAGFPSTVNVDRVIVLAEVLDVPLSELVPEEVPENARTDAQLTLALRNYGLNDADITRTLEQARYYLSKAAERDKNHKSTPE